MSDWNTGIKYMRRGTGYFAVRDGDMILVDTVRECPTCGGRIFTINEGEGEENHICKEKKNDDNK